MVIGDEENWRLLYWRAGATCVKPPSMCRNDYPSFLACWQDLDRMTMTDELDPKNLIGLTCGNGKFVSKESILEIAWRQDWSAEEVYAQLVQE